MNSIREANIHHWKNDLGSHTYGAGAYETVKWVKVHYALLLPRYVESPACHRLSETRTQAPWMGTIVWRFLATAMCPILRKHWVTSTPDGTETHRLLWVKKWLWKGWKFRDNFIYFTYIFPFIYAQKWCGKNLCLNNKSKRALSISCNKNAKCKSTCIRV